MVETQEVSVFDAELTAVDDINAPETIPAQHLQSFPFGGGRFEVSDSGIFYIGTDDEGNDKKPLFVCSRLDVIGLTSATHGDNWGRLVEFRDKANRDKRIPIPATLWQGDGLDLRKMLADLGLDITSNGTGRKLMLDYLSNAPAQTHFQSVDKLGWHNGAFVLPNQVISNDVLDNIIYQSSNPPPAITQAGSIEQWREHIAGYAVGNPYLMFAICTAFASPMLHLAGFRNSVGFHIRGQSSKGKSTGMESAVSVWGNPESYMRTWRNTANALEGTALAHNDCFLALDELSQIDAKQLDQAIYTLANGQAKGRANKTGQTSALKTWRVLYLSNGEISLSEKLATAGIRTNTGMEVRFIDIASTELNGYFITETHGMDGATLSNLIKSNAGKYHGTVGIEWLNFLVENQEEIRENINKAISQFMRAVLPANATSQHKRVCEYFGLVCAAGTNSSHLTGWDKMEVFNSCKRIFLEWFDSFGADDKETSNILNHVKGFIEAHGSSRFENINSNGEERVNNRVGFVRSGDNGLEYLVMPEAFKNEICKGHDPKQVVKVLRDAGMLIPSKNQSQQLVRIASLGKNPKRLYVLTLDNE